MRIFESFGPYAALVAAVATKMADMGLSPEDVLRDYDAYMAEQMADMIPAAKGDERRVMSEELKESSRDTRRAAGQPDTEFRLGPCPRCGAEVWGVRKCAHISPPWRTFLACDGDDCDYHGRSRLDVESLRRRWPDGVETD